MSDRESFIARWSRRKRAALASEASGQRGHSKVRAHSASEDARERAGDTRAESGSSARAAADDATKPAAAPEQAAAPPADEPVRDENVRKAGGASGVPELPFDPATLPPIESITAESDVRAFLAPGVPPELTRAALRRAWATDPKVRNFVGLADYDWDFNAPGAMTGFGSLEMTDELRRQVEEMVGRSIASGESERTAPAAAAARTAPPEIGTTGASIESSTARARPTEPSVSKGGITQDEPIKTSDDQYNSNERLERDQVGIATQQNLEQPNNVELIAKRLHGRALPK
jgi:Protein of unknown function (DUF3306)